MARVVIQGAGTYTPVEVMNPLEEDVILYKNMHLEIVSRLPSLITICSLEEKVHRGQLKRLLLNFQRSWKTC